MDETKDDSQAGPPVVEIRLVARGMPQVPTSSENGNVEASSSLLPVRVTGRNLASPKVTVKFDE